VASNPTMPLVATVDGRALWLRVATSGLQTSLTGAGVGPGAGGEGWLGGGGATVTQMGRADCTRLGIVDSPTTPGVSRVQVELEVVAGPYKHGIPYPAELPSSELLAAV